MSADEPPAGSGEVQEDRDPVMVVAQLLQKMYPQNPDIVLGREARRIIEALNEAGLVVLRDEPNHYVTFDVDGWFVEHSIACRVAGTIGTCEFNAAVRQVADEGPPGDDELGRWRITDIDSEGLPSLERAT